MIPAEDSFPMPANFAQPAASDTLVSEARYSEQHSSLSRVYSISLFQEERFNAQEVASLTESLLRAGIHLSSPKKNKSKIASDAHLWIPTEAELKQVPKTKEQGVIFNTGAQDRSKWICWLPASKKTASALPEGLLQLPPEQLLISRAHNTTRLVMEIKNWLSRPKGLPVLPSIQDWLWFVHPTESGLDQDLLVMLGQEHQIKRQVLDASFLQQLQSPKQLSQLQDCPGIVVYCDNVPDWAEAFAKQLWRATRMSGLKTQILILANRNHRRNQFLKIELPGITLRTFENETNDTSLLKPNSEATAPTHSSTHTVSLSPYMGLRPYSEADSPFFVGRSESVTQVLDQVKHNHYVFVSGASGEGKSSLVYAGIIPAMRAGYVNLNQPRWAVVAFRPEGNPLRSLACSLHQALHCGQKVQEVEAQLGQGFSSLVDLFLSSQKKAQGTSPPNGLLLVVDQMEELFTYSENYSNGQLSTSAYTTATLLSETLNRARSEKLPIYVVFTLRTEYLGSCVNLPGFANLVGQSVYFTPKLPPHALEDVIQLPARMMGSEWDSGLTQQLLLDVETVRDPLPMLQHSLGQIWKKAQGASLISLKHYHAASGSTYHGSEESNRLQEILNRHADNLCFQARASAQAASGTEMVSGESLKVLIESLFRSVIHYDGNNIVRRQCSLSELLLHIKTLDISFASVVAVLDVFRHPDHTFIRPFSEASPESSQLEPHTHLDLTHEALIRNWHQYALWAEQEVKDVRMLQELKAQTDRWNSQNQSSKYLLSSGMASYFQRWVDESKPQSVWMANYLHASANEASKPPLEHAQKLNQDMQKLLQRSLGIHQRSRRLTKVALLIIGSLALLSATLYWNTYTQTKKTITSNRQVIQKERELAEKQRIINANLERESANSRLLAEQRQLISEQKLLQEEQMRKQAIGQALEAEQVARLAQIEREMAEKQQKIAENLRKTAEEQRRLADLQTGIERETADRARQNADKARSEQETAEKQRNVALTFESQFLASLAQKQTQAHQADVALLLTLRALPNKIANPDRPYVSQAEAALYNAAHEMVNAAAFPVLVGHKNVVTGAFFLPDGQRIVSTSHDRTARIWNIKTGEAIATFTHSNIVMGAEYSSDGQWLLVHTNDYQASLWNLRTNRLDKSFGDNKALIRKASISSNGRWVATISGENAAQVWDRQSGQMILDVQADSRVMNIAFSSQSNLFVVCTENRTASSWDLLNGNRISECKSHQGPVNDAAYSPDGRLLATGSDDRAIRIWNVQTGNLIHTLYGHSGPVSQVVFHPLGLWLASLSEDGSTRIWSMNGQELAILPQSGGPGAELVISPNGQRIVTNNSQRHVRLWDGTSFLPLASFDEKTAQNYHFNFHPNGHSIALAGHDFRTRVYKVLPYGQELIDYCQSQLKKRELTEAELNRYLNK